MNHPNVSLILATGGAGMVKSAYSAANRRWAWARQRAVPIHKDVDIERACTDLIISRRLTTA